MERKFIRQFNAVADGYNQACASFGGRIRKVRNVSRSPLSAEHQAKIAASVRRAHAEEKEKISC
jgi:hypothetical protein